MSEKKHNSLTNAKVLLRHDVLSEFKTPAVVLDVFAGPGEMWDLAYGRTKDYLGIELDETQPTQGRDIRFGQSLEVLKTLDLDRFNVFDLDAFANPWSEFEVILSRFRGSRAAFFLTESLGRNIGRGAIVSQMAEYVTPSYRRGFKHNRVGIFREILNRKATEYGWAVSSVRLFEKKRQPKTIYAGFIGQKKTP